MLQRYRVFLNDKEITLGTELKTLSEGPITRFDFTDKASLAAAYDRFKHQHTSQNLFINTPQNFDEACSAFNSMFKRIAAAGGIVRNPRGEYLFIKRLGKWDLPKGKLNKNEAPSQGALREVTEETGLVNLSLVKPLASTFHIYTDRKGKEVLKETYWFEMMCKQEQKLVPQLEEYITEVKWLKTSELEAALQNTYASLRHLLTDYMEHEK